MEKFSINQVYQEYDRNSRDLEFINYEYALEESLSSNSNQNEESDGAKSNKFKDRFTSAIKKIQQIIVSIFTRLGNTIGRIMESDKGFRKKMIAAEGRNKPLEAIKLIMFQYVDQTLDSAHESFKRKINGIINAVDVNDPKKLEDDTYILNMSKEQIESTILKEIGVPSEVRNMSDYYFYIRKVFRGPKKEMLIKGSNIRYWIKICETTKSLENTLKAEKNILNGNVRRLESEMKRAMFSTESSDKVKGISIRQIIAAGHLFNIYSSFINVMIELKAEQMMTARIVVSKLLQF